MLGVLMLCFAVFLQCKFRSLILTGATLVLLWFTPSIVGTGISVKKSKDAFAKEFLASKGVTRSHYRADIESIFDKGNYFGHPNQANYVLAQLAYLTNSRKRAARAISGIEPSAANLTDHYRSRMTKLVLFANGQLPVAKQNGSSNMEIIIGALIGSIFVIAYVLKMQAGFIRERIERMRGLKTRSTVGTTWRKNATIDSHSVDLLFSRSQTVGSAAIGLAVFGAIMLYLSYEHAYYIFWHAKGFVGVEIPVEIFGGLKQFDIEKAVSPGFRDLTQSMLLLSLSSFAIPVGVVYCIVKRRFTVLLWGAAAYMVMHVQAQDRFLFVGINKTLHPEQLTTRQLEQVSQYIRTRKHLDTTKPAALQLKRYADGHIALAQLAYLKDRADLAAYHVGEAVQFDTSSSRRRTLPAVQGHTLAEPTGCRVANTPSRATQRARNDHDDKTPARSRNHCVHIDYRLSRIRMDDTSALLTSWHTHSGTINSSKSVCGWHRQDNPLCNTKPTREFCPSVIRRRTQN